MVASKMRLEMVCLWSVIIFFLVIANVSILSKLCSRFSQDMGAVQENFGPIISKQSLSLPQGAYTLVKLREKYFLALHGTSNAVDLITLCMASRCHNN